MDETRKAHIEDFLKREGWRDAKRRTIAGDASTRSYIRLEKGETTAVLMNAPPAAETAPCPPDADEATRMTLGYNAQARLAGPNLQAFISMAEALRGSGLSAPRVLAADCALGLALIEDLGDGLYARVLADGAGGHIDEETLYQTAVEALVALRRAAPAPIVHERYQTLSYDRVALAAETRLLPQWYWRHKTGVDPEMSLADAYDRAFAPAIDALRAPSLLVLRDFHAENLLWLPERAGIARVGVIDFQDALLGNPAYDLVSLLEDARRDVAPELAARMLDHYAAHARDIPDFDEAAFRRDYAILGAQRNAKILGIFARLVHRDGKQRYLDFIPRVEAHFRNDLKDPALADLRAVLTDALPELAQ